MPHYYFDIHDGKRLLRDDMGVELIDGRAVQAAAVGVLPCIAREEAAASDRCDLTVRVRGPDGRYLYEACLSMQGQWLDERA